MKVMPGEMLLYLGSFTIVNIYSIVQSTNS